MSAFLFYLFFPLVLAGFLWEAAYIAFSFGRSLYCEMIVKGSKESWKDSFGNWRFKK